MGYEGRIIKKSLSQVVVNYRESGSKYALTGVHKYLLGMLACLSHTHTYIYTQLESYTYIIYINIYEIGGW